ncbi:unnamed protein product [Moneuplotes crassus]|uniref:Uncharacterized protein n=1 Tax=Euplotes crassus TaxID=5936 RepID=A0AAD1UF87_EUPCR|nr:unnamed protein product [Moneuplotes crassus]
MSWRDLKELECARRLGCSRRTRNKIGIINNENSEMMNSSMNDEGKVVCVKTYEGMKWVLKKEMEQVDDLRAWNNCIKRRRELDGSCVLEIELERNF